MAYVVINDARDPTAPGRESDELELTGAIELAQRVRQTSGEPLRIVDAATGRTLLYLGHDGFRCIDRRKSPRTGWRQLDGGFSRPCARLDDAIARAAKELASCLRRGIEALIEVVDGDDRVYWRNGRFV